MRPPSGGRRAESAASTDPERSGPAPSLPRLPVRTRYVELTPEERADLEKERYRVTSPGRAITAEPVAEGRVDDGSIWRLYGGPDPARGICFALSELSRDRQEYGGSGSCRRDEFSVEGSSHGGRPTFEIYGFGDYRGHALLVSSSDGRVATLPVARDKRLERAFFIGHFECGAEVVEVRLLDHEGATLAVQSIDFSRALCREPAS